jgi:hypothetical protein
MGYLTTITFRNDEYHEIANRVNDNSMVSQAPVHSGETVIYVCSGNTTINVSSGLHMEEMSANHPSFFGELAVAVAECGHRLTKLWAGVHKKKKREGL